jgi:alpha-ribazole phosphatase/probable phosphoglycerate mutase
MAGTFCGHSDPPLSAQGRAQLPSLTALSREWDLQSVYASDLQRARETAQALADANKLPLTLLCGLREISFGEWEGLTWQEIETRDPNTSSAWLQKFPAIPTPGGELYTHFAQRVVEALQTIETSLSTGSVAVVSHAGVLREILAQRSGISTGLAWEWTREYGAWIVMRADGTILETSTERVAQQNV